MSYIQKLFAKRIGGEQFGKGTAVYKFEKIKIAKRKALIDNPNLELLDFGIGEPDKPPAMEIIDELHNAAKNMSKHGYTDTGTDDFRKAAAVFMKRQFNVELDFCNEVLPIIGIKEALSNIPKAFINSGDVCLMTTPGYPVMGTNSEYMGGEVYNIPLKRENNFLPDLTSVPSDVIARAKMLYLNYPNNPTGAVATLEFYSSVVAFAKEHDILVVVDAPYATITFGTKPISFLEVPGAMDVGVELHSFSKSYAMCGWRLGFAVGNSLIVKGLATVKDNMDSGSFEAIQKAGIFALEHPELNDKETERYERRLRLLVDGLAKIGLKTEMPKGTFYLFVPAPKSTSSGVVFDSAEAFSQWLITQKGIVTVPWDDNGDSYIRFSATYGSKGEDEERRICEELVNRLSCEKYLF